MQSFYILNDPLHGVDPIAHTHITIFISPHFFEKKKAHDPSLPGSYCCKRKFHFFRCLREYFNSLGNHSKMTELVLTSCLSMDCSGHG